MYVSLTLALGVLVMALALMVVVALAEVGLATISRSNVRRLREAGVSAASIAEQLLNDAERFLAGLLVLRMLAIGAIAATVTWLALWWRLNAWYLIGMLLMVGAGVLFVQVGARVLAVQHPTGVMLRVVPFLRWLLWLAAPITWLLLRLVYRSGLEDANNARNIFLTEDGLRLLLNVGEEEKFIEADEREMIDSIFRLSERAVAEVMVPRVDVVGVDLGATLAEALDVCVTSGHSRIPVYEDTIDNIVGVLYAKDLLTHIREGKPTFSLREIMRKPYFVPEPAMVNDLLGELQHRKTHLSIVVDEYGGTAGIVTIEDLLEEIVGDIQDEYDREAPLIQSLEPGVYLVSGRANLDDLNRELGLKISDEDESYTLAGVLYSRLQRVPDVGDTLDLGDAHLEVLAVTDNRIDQVRLMVKQPAEEKSTDEIGGQNTEGEEKEQKPTGKSRGAGRKSQTKEAG